MTQSVGRMRKNDCIRKFGSQTLGRVFKIKFKIVIFTRKLAANIQRSRVVLVQTTFDGKLLLKILEQAIHTI